jgi:hypothetical protein
MERKKYAMESTSRPRAPKKWCLGDAVVTQSGERGVVKWINSNGTVDVRRDEDGERLRHLPPASLKAV